MQNVFPSAEVLSELLTPIDDDYLLTFEVASDAAEMF